MHGNTKIKFLNEAVCVCRLVLSTCKVGITETNFSGFVYACDI